MTILRRLLGVLFVLVGCTAVIATGLALLWPERLQQSYRPPLPRVETAEPVAAPHPGAPIGMLEIPRLGLSSVVLEGDDGASLLLGVGHLSDTPLPWHGGNSVLAAHRDTFFRPLAGIRLSDIIRFTTADAEFEYVVRETRIVEPTDVEVLHPTPSATLTLITCHPFDYIGPAPNRFIVRAERRSGERAQAGTL